jgi:hypothetical protein
MKTPPIPPASPYFRDEFFIVQPEMSITIALFDPPACWRPVIAAVAIVAWEEEGMRKSVHGFYSVRKQIIAWRSWRDAK